MNPALLCSTLMACREEHWKIAASAVEGVLHAILLPHVCRARVANSEEHWKMIRVPFGRGVAGRVAETGTSMNIPDAYNCDLFNPGIDRKTGFRTRNILCVPISDMSGNHVAVIQVGASLHFFKSQKHMRPVGKC